MLTQEIGARPLRGYADCQYGVIALGSSHENPKVGCHSAFSEGQPTDRLRSLVSESRLVNV